MAARDAHEDAIDEALRRQLETGWAEGRPEPIQRLLPPEDDANYLPTLEEVVRIELELAWKSWSKAEQRASAGPRDETIARPPQVETYLKRFPQLNQPGILLRLLKQESAVRKQCGQPASIDEYRRRFPDLEIPEGQFEAALPMVSDFSRDTPLADTLAIDRPSRPIGRKIAPGAHFGNYELLDEIGRGGMGVVYRARQCTADRIVALKLIQRERLEALPRDTQTSALDRFRHEAQAAARLEHEHIVTVYEVGEVEGQPFFSMRYVDGRTLAQMVREGPIENRRAAAYIEPVARAVHEAHQLGILHRDLKPQNILADAKTDRALVADFGLAKLSEGQEELTRAGEVMGTPSYMSPEQAKDSAQVTATTDIYALGATLYHVLTGRPPFHAATPIETLRQVIDEEPAPPRQLNRSIDRDLETICLKCLQKEPARRYESAEALAGDLRRYLRGEPILARPISTFGRTVRWCRRNPVMATWVALAATCLALALVASTVGYIKTSAALEQSEESLAHAREAVHNFYTSISETELLNEPGLQPLRQKLLSQARNYYRQLLDEHGDDPAVQDDLAEAYFHVGRITELIDSPDKALPSYRRALQMQRQLVSERPDDLPRLEALGNTANAIGNVLVQMQKLDQAFDAYTEAIVTRKQLVDAAPEDTEFKRTLANSYMNLGLVEKERGNHEAAIRQIETAQELRAKLLDRDRGDRKVRRDLGKGYYNLANLAMKAGDAQRAQKNLEGAINAFENLLESNPKDLHNQSRLAICYRALIVLKGDELKKAAKNGDSAERLYQETVRLYQKALQRTQTLARENPAVPDYQADLARLYMNLGQLESGKNHPAEALTSLTEAYDILKRLLESYPNVPEYRWAFAVTLREIALLQAAGGQHSAARESLQSARKHADWLVEQSPQTADYQGLLSQITADLDNLNTAQPPEKDE